MIEGVKDIITLQHVMVGEMLAAGHTNNDIIDSLQATFEIPTEAAQDILRSVFDSWSSIRVTLKLQSEDDRNWHQHLRMKLLQKVLLCENVSSQNLALRILDSLATIQGIVTTTEQFVPLPIVLVEAREKES